MSTEGGLNARDMTLNLLKNIFSDQVLLKNYTWAGAKESKSSLRDLEISQCIKGV